MTRALALALAMLMGVLLGAAGVDGLNARGKAPGAYAIVEIGEIKDQRGLQRVLAKMSEAAESFGGRTITQANRITGRDAVPPNTVVLIAFDNIEDAEAWSTSAVEAELDEARDKAAQARSFLLDQR